MSTEELALDLVAFLTFAALGLLPALKRRFKRLLTTQFVFDEVSDELTLERAGLRNAGNIYLRGDRYVMEPAPAVVTEEKRQFLEKILGACPRNHFRGCMLWPCGGSTATACGRNG